MNKQTRTKQQQTQTTKRKANTFAGLKKARLQWTPCQPYRTIIVWYDIDNPEPLKVAGIDYDPRQSGPCGAMVTEYFTEDDLYLILAGFHHHPDPNVLCGRVVHEAVHIVNMTFEHHGVRLDTDNDEHQAYFTELVATEGFKAMGALFNGA